MRKRDQTHSYWYIPSAPRENYSLPVMESTGMMKMATGDDIPLPQGARIAPRLVIGGYRGLQRRNSRSRFLSEGFYIYRNFWRREQVSGGPRVNHKDGRRALQPYGWLGTLLAQIFCFGGFFWSIKKCRKFLGQLDSVWYSFSKNSKTRKKQKLAQRSRLIAYKCIQNIQDW